MNDYEIVRDALKTWVPRNSDGGVARAALDRIEAENASLRRFYDDTLDMRYGPAFPPPEEPAK